MGVVMAVIVLVLIVWPTEVGCLDPSRRSSGLVDLASKSMAAPES